MNKKISLRDAYAFGFNSVFSHHFWKLAALLLVSWAIPFVALFGLILAIVSAVSLAASVFGVTLTSLVGYAIGISFGALVLLLFYLLVIPWVLAGYIKASLAFIDTKRISLATLFSQRSLLGKMIRTFAWTLPIFGLVFLLVGIFTFGMISFGHPSQLTQYILSFAMLFFWLPLIRLFFVVPIVVDKKIGGLAPFKESWRITKGNGVPLIIFYVISAVISHVPSLIGLGASSMYPTIVNNKLHMFLLGAFHMLFLLVFFIIQGLAWLAMYRQLEPAKN